MDGAAVIAADRAVVGVLRSGFRPARAAAEPTAAQSRGGGVRNEGAQAVERGPRPQQPDVEPARNRPGLLRSGATDLDAGLAAAGAGHRSHAPACAAGARPAVDTHDGGTR